MQTEPPKRQRLHSPILGGGGGAADDNYDDDSASSPSFGRSRGASQSGGGQTGGQKTTGARGLRSPLLGASDADDMDEPDPAPRGKGGFGAFGHGPKQKKTEFPHRHHDEDDHGDISNQSHSPSPQGATGGQKNTASRGGLRSPLLGGGAGDGDYAGGYDDQHDNRSDNRSNMRPSKPGRLRSPILGGSGDDYQEEIFDDEVEEINDPTVLRSPLLAVRTPKAHTGANTGVNMGASQAPSQGPSQLPVGGPKAAPFVQGPYTQASAGSAPSFSLQTPPLPAPQSAMGNAPMAPSQPPAYTPPPAPPAPVPAAPAMPAPMPSQANNAGGALNNSEYSYGVNPRSAAQSASPDYSTEMPTAPSGFLSAPVSPSNSTNNNMAPMAPSLPIPPAPTSAPQAKSVPAADNFDASEESAPKARGMRGSKLLGGDVSDDPAGPLDRRSRFADRRTTPSRTDRRTGYSATDIDDDNEPMGRGGQPAAAASNPMAPIAMALAVVALIAKGYYIMAYAGNPAFFTTMLPASLDQICTLLFLVGFILFALKASQKS